MASVTRRTTTVGLVYTRASSHVQEGEGVSLPAQLSACRKYAAAKGWIIGAEFTDVLSGKRDDRPGYQRLVTEVRDLRAEGRPVVVIVARLDRFGRRLLERVERRNE